MLHLSEAERAELLARARHGRGSADVGRRAKVVLLLAGGRTYAEIQATTGISRRTIDHADAPVRERNAHVAAAARRNRRRERNDACRNEKYCPQIHGNGLKYSSRRGRAARSAAGLGADLAGDLVDLGGCQTGVQRQREDL